MMKKILELYRVFLRLNVQKAMVYRGTYIAGVVGQWLGYGVTFASLYIMLSRFEVLAGWNRYEVLVLYGLSVLSYALSATVFFVPTQDLAMKVRTGELDQILSKPVHPFLYEIMQGFCPNYLSHISLAAAVLVFAFAKLHYKPEMVSMLYLALMLAGGILIQSAVFIAGSSVGFFTVQDNPVVDMVYTLKGFVNYPITIFPRALQFFLTFMLPFAFINFYPAAMLLQKEIPAGYPAVLPYLPPVVGIFVFVLSIRLWNWGLSHYQGTGS